jgi:hypothetical protein
MKLGLYKKEMDLFMAEQVTVKELLVADLG